MARGERRSNGDPPVNEPGAKKPKNQATIANVTTFNDRRVAIGKLRNVCMKSISSMYPHPVLLILPFTSGRIRL
jgi:hypothetical protein